jgi:uncharacterized protein YgbK (DUF1537 family)
MKIQNKAALLSTLPPEWPQGYMPDIERSVYQAGIKIIVLDDDPTGNQTVHDVVVLTEWSIPSLCNVFTDPAPVVYILTNSRSTPLPQAQKLNQEIAENLNAACSITGRDFVVISRSDSTLRGHYPGEVNTLKTALGLCFDGILIIPFFVEGGRITIADTHYVTSGNDLIPAGETEFARDPVFGYRNSNLRAWISEKSEGVISPEDVASISLNDIRLDGPDAVIRKLSMVTEGQVVVVNAVTYRDLEVFVTGLLQVEQTGKRFLYRTAASFVRVRGGIHPRSLLTAADLDTQAGGGLIIAGSYVDKTTQQLNAMQELSHVQNIRLSVPTLLDPIRRKTEIQQVTKTVNDVLKVGHDAVLFTSREVITTTEKLTMLQIGQTISHALVSIVAGLTCRPSWIIAKGGITASDIAVKALGVHRGYVLGQILPGIPVWRTGEKSHWPGLIYVVFPGNVGDSNALKDIVRKLHR